MVRLTARRRSAYELPASRLRRTIRAGELPRLEPSGGEPPPPPAPDPTAGPQRREAAREMMIGQRRAMDAIDFGLRMHGRGFNIYVLGEPGSGKTTSVERTIEARAAEEPVGRDICYVYDFDEPERPRGLPLPAGTAEPLARGVERAVADLAREIPRALGTAAFREERNRILDGSHAKIEQRFVRLARQGRRFGLLVRRDADRLLLAPLKDGQPLTSEQYEALPDDERGEFESRSTAFQRRLPEYERQLRQIQKGMEEALLEAERAAIQHVVQSAFDELRRNHAELGEPIHRYFEQFQAHVMDNHRLFLPPEEQAGAAPPPGTPPPPEGMFPAEPPAPVQDHVPFRVNVLVDRRRETCAPVIVERNPTYPNLFGYLEYRETHGVFSTDHLLIRPGALHRANGGYLVIQVSDLLRSAYAWDALKRALRHQELRIEELEEEARPKTTGTVRPTPVALQVKVILVGSPDAYYALQSQDEDFSRLFKVKADFEPFMPFGPRTLAAVSRFVTRAAREEGLLPLDRGALARLLEHGVREANDQARISTRLATLIDLACEANYWARRARRRALTAPDVERALAERSGRHAKDEDGVLQEVRDGMILIDTRGAVVGQVNGLTVYDQGDHVFGVPSRITARTYVGPKEVVNIDREVRLSGSIHDKGALILVGYLGGRFAQDKPLSLSASITFEQNYGLVEGDSASAAELIALLSSLADLPIRQGVAVTGSVNQQGEIQPVGAVNEKIEGFYKVCRLRGLTGHEGVIIPRLNVRNLMLDAEVVAAVRKRRFHLFAIDHIDEGIEILTGRQAGARRPDGSWAPGTVNERVDRRLRELGEVLRRHRTF